MRFASGALSALARANSSDTDDAVEQCTLDGDLSQMGTMFRALSEAGFDVRHSDVYPVLQGAEIVPGLRYLWDHRVPGWWNQRAAFIKHGICTAEEYRGHF
jgi:hypothetical protein